MSMTKQHPIKAVLNLRTLTPEVVLSTSTHIFTEIYNNPNYTPPQAPGESIPVIPCGSRTTHQPSPQPLPGVNPV